MEKTDSRKILVNWLVKIRILKDQIEKLEKLKDFPIIAIATFLLKCQIIEFELKQIISSLDLHLYFQNRSRLFRKKIRTPRDLDDLTLGKLVREIKQFIRPSSIPFTNKISIATGKQARGDLSEELKINLDLLVEKRNEFNHKLFSQGKDVKKISEEAKKGLEVANQTLILFELLQKEIKNYEK